MMNNKSKKRQGNPALGYDWLKIIKIIISAMFVFAVGVSVAIPDTISPQISINTDMGKNEPGVIKTQVYDEMGVSKVTLFYRKSGEIHFNSIDMQSDNDEFYYRELRKELGMEGNVEYYLLAQDTSGNESTLPGLNPQDNPLTASMEDAVNISADEIVLGSPTPGEVYDSGEQLVMITFYRTGRAIDFNSIRLRIDKIDRTREADLMGNTLMWEPRRPFIDGVHEIEVLAKDVDGEPVGPNIWTFQVKTRMALPLSAEGDFYLGIQRDDRSAISKNVPLWNNKMDLGIRGQTSWMSWKTGVMLSSEETSFLTSESLPDRQPINRYYAEARTRHLQVRFGDSNPNFSDLSLKGVLVRGVNASFKSNRFNTTFVWGYNKREIQESTNIIGTEYQAIGTDLFRNLATGDTISTSSNDIIAIMDPNAPGSYNIYEYSPGTPKRDVVGLKMNVAPVRNRYASWDFGFNFFGAEDDTTTLKYRYDADNNTRYYAYQDDIVSNYADYKPKKNWVGTLESTLKFNNNKSEISTEIGGTIVTENMFSYITEDIQDEIEDIESDLFPINGSTQTSFDKLKLKDDTAGGLKDAISSVYKFKFITEVPIPLTKTRFNAEAYRTPTHYVSLGNPQQKTDVDGYKFALKTRILQNQVSFNVGYNAYSDNINSERKQYSNESFDQKDLTKDTTIMNFSIGYNPNRWRVYSPSVTLGFRNYKAQNDLDIAVSANDTTSMIDASTNTVMLNLGGSLPVGMQRHVGMLSISNMSISDNRPLADYDLNESNNLTVMLNVNSQIHPLPVSFAVSAGHTSNAANWKDGDMTTGYRKKEVTTGITLFNLAGTYKWFRDKRLKTTAGIGFIGSSNGEDGTSGIPEIDNSKTTFKIEVDYKLTSVSSAGAMIRFINYADNVNSGKDYSEPIIGLNLRSAF